MNIPFNILSLFLQCFVYFPALYVTEMSVVGSPPNPVWGWDFTLCIFISLRCPLSNCALCRLAHNFKIGIPFILKLGKDITMSKTHFRQVCGHECVCPRSAVTS